MRTNIVLNEDLVNEAMRYSQARSKKALIEEALRTLIETRAAEQRNQTYASRLAALQHKTAALKFRQSAHELIREDRDRSR